MAYPTQTAPAGYWDNGTWWPYPEYTVPQEPAPKCPFTLAPTWGTPDYLPELRRIADALEKLAGRSLFGFSVQRPRKCVVCKREGDEMQDGFTLGYGSEHDGEWVCEECLHRIVDQEIERLGG
jgi:hypothetical protein